MTQGSGLPPAAHYDVTECIVVARLGHYPEKVEGMAVMDNGDVYVCNDNDGVDDNSGETQLLNVGGIL